MGTVYITHEDAFIGKTDERLTVKADRKKLLDIPLLKTEGIVVLGRATISPAAMDELLERQIPLSFLTGTGRYRGRVEPELSKNIFVRRAQWSVLPGSAQAVHCVQGFVRGKLKNYRQSLLRRQRENEQLPLAGAIAQLDKIIPALEAVESIDSLRGLEGAGSAAYFGVFDHLIRAEAFTFRKRVRRPPTDPVNALLSLGYALLRHDVQSAVNIVGFDPYLGYLHTEQYGRPSLALDLMEEFRPLMVDAVVLSGLNNQRLTSTNFESEPLSRAVSLTKEGLKTFLRLYEQKKQKTFKHPVMKRNCSYQQAFEWQARLLAKYLMGETEIYPPLILK
ncbi:MAG: type I-D CRISPR-associated endonuclease Cas1 [Spirulina sp. SIO3F2]|nr:type I-D CRISPR-associated endonuclease Cas1 [Spirulina sp. SIO3F2]